MNSGGPVKEEPKCKQGSNAAEKPKSEEKVKPGQSELPSVTATKTFSCDICHKHISRARDVIRHKKIHITIKSFLCKKNHTLVIRVTVAFLSFLTKHKKIKNKRRLFKKFEHRYIIKVHTINEYIQVKSTHVTHAKKRLPTLAQHAEIHKDDKAKPFSCDVRQEKFSCLNHLAHYTQRNT